MDYQKYIDKGLNGKEPLKLILRGYVENMENNKVGVVSVVYATNDKRLAEKKIQELNNSNDYQNAYHMVYSVPLDTDLTKLEHYPSIEINKEDLL